MLVVAATQAGSGAALRVCCVSGLVKWCPVVCVLRHRAPDRIRKSSTPSRRASSNSHMYWRTASAVPWNQFLLTLDWEAASTSTKPRLFAPPTVEFCETGSRKQQLDAQAQSALLARLC